MNLPLAFVADDFTGATDTLATLANVGWRTRLFLDVPGPAEVAGLDAVGVATAARGMSASDIAGEMHRIGTRLALLAPDTLHLKICSTFDSAPEVGNIAVAARILAERMGGRRIVILGGQPSLGRYCVFGTLFAAGPDGYVHRIDRHPVMARHPVTPMAEADLVRHLGELGLESVTLLDRNALVAGAGLPESDGPVLIDALEPADIARIGVLLQGASARLLCVGSSSVAEALAGKPPEQDAPRFTRTRPILALVGSRSPVSETQAAHARHYVKHCADPEALRDPEQANALVLAVCAGLERGKNQMVRVTAGTDLAPSSVAEASADLVATILRQTEAGALLIAGGDTSSIAVRRLAPVSLDHLATVDRGVALCLADFGAARSPLPVVLKGGQMGDVNLFDKLATELLPMHGNQ